MEKGLSERLVSIADFCKDRRLKASTVRWWVFCAPINGLEAFGAVVKVGRSVFIDPEAIDRWLESQRKV